mmetsp:Transcript_14512/g.22520  ORF Transcript_14512/g.22520 Transcript_14512/m.22520 type:complete len:204 (-) Transcript_14512:596-1207(-)
MQKSVTNDLEKVSLNKDFTPSTPYVHKFRTELCKNYELTGKCRYGDECSFAHGKAYMMLKTDVSLLYKTKLCKKFIQGYCPYGMRCQFIHDASEAIAPPSSTRGEQKFAKKEERDDDSFTMCYDQIDHPGIEGSSLGKMLSMPVASRAFVKGRKLGMSQKASCGFGNKQMTAAFQFPSVIYREVFVHCVHVSVQEYQKKLKMY